MNKTNAFRRILAGILFLSMVGGATASDYVRYVSASKGAYSYDGTSWASAKKNVQDAINDLVDNLNLANGDHGYVFIEAGTYTPTESTEAIGGSTLYMSFKIPAGISVYGGFAGNETADGLSHDTLLYTKREKITTKIGTFMKHQTVLAGNLSSVAKFTWNSSKNQYNTSFFGNCYHVVWFATNGFTENVNGHIRANGLGVYTGGKFEGQAKEALLDGCVIKDGYAFNSSVTERAHNAFGGGIYMVDGAKVTNCEIYHCVASRSGGGVYMDGGGVMENCYVHDCQTLGVDTRTGLGGGIAIDQNGFVYHSAIINNVGRMGGGLSFYYDKELDPSGAYQYTLVSAATLVANNTSAIEGGGAYMYAGGVMNGMTVVNNKNVGSGVTINGLRTGRSGGVYVRDHARIYNSVFWGNETSSNSNNLQYASSRSTSDINLKPILTFVAVSQMDYADWSGTKKINVTKLAHSNEDDGTAAASETYPYFKKPHTTVGHVTITNTGNLSSDSYLNSCDWQPTASSGLCYAGVPLVDIYEVNVNVNQAYATQDINGSDYSPRCSLGAYVAEPETVKHAVIDGVPTIFVDPSRATGKVWNNPGSSWDTPLSNLTDALHYFKEKGLAGNIYVKEGTLYPASRNRTGRMRATTIPMVSNVKVYGGYPTELTGTQMSSGKLRRNPVDYPTVISAKVMDDQYAGNVAHLVTIDGVTDAVLDGVQLRWGNASSNVLAEELKLSMNGGGIYMNNATNIQISNTLVANCAGQQGAAIFVQGTSSVLFENCIFHNNTACVNFEGVSNFSYSLDGGIIYLKNNSSITLNHCDMLHNVGVPVVNAGTGKVSTYNSLYFANMSESMDDTNGQEDKALPAFAGAGTFEGDHNLFDVKASLSAAWDASLGRDIFNFNNQVDNRNYARFVNPTRNAGISTGGDQTYYGRSINFMPSDMNPAVNAASTGGVEHVLGRPDGVWGYDMTGIATRDYGGLPDIGALENGYFVTNTATQPRFGSVIFVRDYNTYTYNEDGSIASTVSTDLNTVHEDGTPRDGSSWLNAINGNSSDYVGQIYAGDDVTYSIDEFTTDITTSTIANPVPYRFTALNGGTRYSIRWVAAQNHFDKCQFDQGDLFIIMADPNGGNYNQIYDLTVGQYVMYVEAEERAEMVRVQQSLYGNTAWFINTTASQNGGTICPAYNNNSWNLYGGTGYLGLYRASDVNSMTWRFHPGVSTTTSVNGLQYAVNSAFEAMEPSFVTRLDVGSEQHNGGSVTTTRTYYDYVATDDNPEVQVWVAAGMYTNPAGYQIRNHVKVYGGFPKEGNPCQNERHPQLTSKIPLSVANQSLGLKVKDYETILQTNTSIAERESTTQSVSVLSHPVECRVTTGDDQNIHQDRVVYEGAEWDGFTIRYGRKRGVTGSGSGRRNGGAGVSLYENVVLRNCIVRDNHLGMSGDRGRGAGIYCDGSAVVNCYVMDNESTCSSENYGGGIYMILGTMYNTVIAGNTIPAGTSNHGNGTFFESANFYNNTIVNNHGGDSSIGVYTASAADAHLTVYNSIVMGGSDPILWLAGASTPCNFNNCFLQTTDPCTNMTSGTYTRLTTTETKFYPSTEATSVNPFLLDYNTAVSNYDYRIDMLEDDRRNCVNEGTEDLGLDYDGSEVYLPDYDMDYTDRVQDCTVDIGAYEFNGAYEITPAIVRDTACFYVTWFGRGFASASNTANAACAAKLQKVLDAAGRYKYQHPTRPVVVKLAGYGEDVAVGKGKIKYKNYYACRTTDYTATDEDVRIWSVMVPRGVELWGGYTEDFETRDIAFNATYIAGTYINNEENSEATAYHVIEFVDEVYDADGKPYKVGDNLTSNSTYTTSDDEESLMKLGDVVTTHRAVVDGLFLKGGKADAEPFNGTNLMNANQYGGVAIVNDFSHVRNCIIKDNYGTYGGALALTSKGLVSGSVIQKNEAQYGGGIYIFENGVRLSNGIVNNTNQEDGSSMDVNMPHIYTSTIVKNKATHQGGGLWFSNDADMPNVRVNSCVLWQNDAPDQANVAGQTSPDMTDDQIGNTRTEDFYPFAYSAVQNLRLSGTNNISVETINRNGTRFATESFAFDIFDEKVIASQEEDFAFYGLTTYSALSRTGMPIMDYNQLVASEALTPIDFYGMMRDAVPATGGNRNFIDIGARALPSAIVADLNLLFTRLYVAQTGDVDMNAAEVIMNMDVESLSDENKRYAQMGSSFAYPFHNVDDALEYIYSARSTEISNKMLNKANNLRFEICIARGNYYPMRDLSGNYGYSLANTYLVPEGVSLLGGFDCLDLYGQDSKPRLTGDYSNVLEDNIDPLDNDFVELSDGSMSVTLMQHDIQRMLNDRSVEDLNLNNIIEPWEFRNQSVLSGKTTNMENEGVYHVVMAIADQELVGQLPLAVESNPSYDEDGYTWKEKGQSIVIDGLEISEGYAGSYVQGAYTSEAINGLYSYYQGGAIMVDGNWYDNSLNGNASAGYKHKGTQNSVGYRDIPLYINRCKINDNQAGIGGAVFTNGTGYVFGTAFEKNRAISGSDRINGSDVNGDGKVDMVYYPGNGGAISFTSQMSITNSLFANNEAYDAKARTSPQIFQTLSDQDATFKEYAGSGGALFGGSASCLRTINCDFVQNKASLYPAIFTLNPNRDYSATPNILMKNYNQVLNTVFWRNQTRGLNFGKNSFATKLAINYGPSNRTGSYDLTVMPADTAALNSSAWAETIWFSAYEQDYAKAARNQQDFREMNISTAKYIPAQIAEFYQSNYSDKGAYYTQNANIVISMLNDELTGPNFRHPSQSAGYDGYSESADWSPGRLNRLTDNGSGYLRQTVESINGSYIARFDKNTDGTYDGEGAYYTFHYQNPILMSDMPIGDDYYMENTNDLQLPRISYDPSPNQKLAYIDIGVYEYMHTELKPEVVGDEVDVIWVSPEEKAENGLPDGSSWNNPTSDLQRAIETLLSSRNGHRKELRLMDGEYMPFYTIHGYQAFYINTEYLNSSVILPTDYYQNATVKGLDNYFVKSFAIKGGYSRELNGVYDTQEYPAVMRSAGRTDGVSTRWNYLLYIADAVQRYGTGSDADTGEGALANNDNQSQTDPMRKSITTVPIQIDGVTLINNQALPGTRGAAIRYDDQVYNTTFKGEEYTYEANAPVQAAVNDPNGTSYRYYTDDTYTTQTSEVTAYKQSYTKIDNPAKLIISRCNVIGSGSHYDAATYNDYSSSAVYIGEHGGDALIYNTIMHSNYGSPLQAYNTRNFNNTIALNHGQVQLKNTGTQNAGLPQWDDEGANGDGPMLSPALRMVTDGGHLISENTLNVQPSQLHNTIMWCNNYTVNAADTIYGKQFMLAGYESDEASSSLLIFTRNAYTCPDADGHPMLTEHQDYTEEDGNLARLHYNTYLSSSNNFVLNGPNFENPMLDATDAEIEERDFGIRPSFRILNKGNKDTYYYGAGGTSANRFGGVYDLTWEPNVDVDNRNNTRVISSDIEIGAIEYLQPLMRVIYVDPNVSQDLNSGESWELALGATDLQNAVDLASVYVMNSGGTTAQKEAYVFVKGGNDGKRFDDEITMRNGVNVFGSVAPGYTTSVPYRLNSYDNEYQYTNLEENVARILADRPSPAAPNAKRSTVKGIATNPEDFYSVNGLPTIIDGFDITPTLVDGKQAAITSPVINIDPQVESGTVGHPSVAIRNCVVRDADASQSDINLANVNGALVYEMLFRDNKVKSGKSTLHLGADAWGVNLTIEGVATDENGTTASSYNSDEGHYRASLINYGSEEKTWKTLVGYNYTMSDAKLDVRSLNYQLAEGSTHIDECDQTSDRLNPAKYLPAHLQSFINYNTDVDLLGNRRLLKGVSEQNRIDRGAFETWKVAANYTVFTENSLSNPHFYPHEGSAVYMMESSNLCLNVADVATVPGYLLVKDGASLYGQGHAVNAAYVSVEKSIRPEGAIVAMPYRMNYNYQPVQAEWCGDLSNAVVGPSTYSYDDDGILTLIADRSAVAYTYNGSVRADAYYRLKNANSECWERLNERAYANQGVNFVPSVAGTDEVTYRYTAKGGNFTDYIYTETANAESKPVAFERHNFESATGNGELTSLENMSWNCFGIPYLVSEYMPYLGTDGNAYTDGAYMMQTPRQLWLYYDGKQMPDGTVDNVNGAGFYPVNSWEDGTTEWHIATDDSPRLWVGEGLFAQSATHDVTEQVDFYLPVFGGASRSMMPYRNSRVYVRDAFESDSEELDLEGYIYDMYGRRVEDASQHGIYLVNGKKVSR